MEKIKELICYSFVGVLTTIANYVVYFICLNMHLNWLISNSFAWLIAVIFAYVTNRRHVFHSQNDMKKECAEFFGMRFITLIVENILLAICIDGLGISNMISKMIVSVVTVIGNYWLCKYHIFSKKEEACYE